ncbi:hypothetical protein R7D64_14075 [Vibrio sp. Vb2535]|uniref:hypothetical protein n=1 Tax=Vibrio TaxID=662 RepID=UPI0029652B6F|nr:hypothetical protein [Vibrio sp. Vb2535]MDW1754047.1 hypothetical protein [Vibrio sp. Vb2535]
MDLLILVKVVPIIVGIFGIGRVIYELISGVKDKLREEYKFAKEFLDNSNIDKLHPFTREKGYQAIAGSSQVTQKEIEFILSLSNPVQRLKDFKNSRQLFENMEANGDFKLVYKKRYQFNTYRNVIKGWYLLCYGILAFMAASPFIFPEWFGQQGMLALVITIPSFGFYSVLSLISYGKLKAAERLIDHVKHHTDNIVLDI